MGQAIAAHPKFFIEADGVDDERVAFLTTDGVAATNGMASSLLK